MFDFTCKLPWSDLLFLTVPKSSTSKTYVNTFGTAGLIMKPDIVASCSNYFWWLHGQRTAGNVLFAEVLADALLRFFDEQSRLAPRLENHPKFAASIKLLTHGTFFEGLHFTQFNAEVIQTEDTALDDCLLCSNTGLHGTENLHSPYIGTSSKRNFVVYRRAQFGMFTYSGPGRTDCTLESALSLRVASPLRLWHINT